MTASANALTDTAGTTGGGTGSAGARAAGGNRGRRRAAGGFAGSELVDRSISGATDRISAYPLIAIAAGVTVGVALGAMLPRSRREQEMLGAVGQKVTDAARDVADTAMEAGRQQFEDMQKTAMAKVGEAVVAAVVSGDDKTA